ncbi:hypothetical protein K504DRAFT_488072 [Pleomassaria siparia CBS 279.74]|uniref:Uncharacterized protein n=1 Tax=Pleomassaria siparia CBS 279.74 TaxID=1314801 RepID=A0A6G1KMX1_9PLEO|nr:hypothetical protein K504DRAFT_488072 [Pleomassaria siparia CBS 279.74]
MHLPSFSLTTLAALLPPTDAHPHAPPTTPSILAFDEARQATPGFCWITMYKEPRFGGVPLRIGFGDHECYDFTYVHLNFPDDYRTGVKSVDIEQQCICRIGYGSFADVDEGGVERDGNDGLWTETEMEMGAVPDCGDGYGGDWAKGRKELTGKLRKLTCSGPPGHGQEGHAEGRRLKNTKESLDQKRDDRSISRCM